MKYNKENFKTLGKRFNFQDAENVDFTNLIDMLKSNFIQEYKAFENIDLDDIYDAIFVYLKEVKTDVNAFVCFNKKMQNLTHKPKEDEEIKIEIFQNRMYLYNSKNVYIYPLEIFKKND